MESKQLEAIQLIQFDPLAGKKCNEKLWHGLLSVLIQDQINAINGWFLLLCFIFIFWTFPFLSQLGNGQFP